MAPFLIINSSNQKAMDNDNNTMQHYDDKSLETTQQPCEVQEQQLEEQQPDTVAAILERLGVSDSIATSARAIIDGIEAGKTPGENFVKLIVNALNHDEDMKNAEAAGYLRGRNEVIEAASKLNDDQHPNPVNFPIYRKRSFWD
jgi:hypothetical protein